MSKVGSNTDDNKISSTTKECILCRNEIPIASIKCHQCQSFQDLRRHINFALPVISLLIAFFATAPLFINPLVSYFSAPKPQYSVLSFAGVNVTDDDGDINNPTEFGVSAQIFNLGSKTLVIDDSIQCTLRRDIYKKNTSKRTLDGKKRSDSQTFEKILFQFNFYIEKSSHTVLHPGETTTIKWTTQNSSKLELFGYLDAHAQSRGEYEHDEVVQFFKEILERIALVSNQWPNIDGGRGYIESPSGKLQSFFSNMDCRFTVDNGFHTVEEEIHLEFMYEADGKEGKYPRWRIGKNIGFGFGNGAGNGT